MMRSSPVFGIAAALILAFCGAEPQLRSRAYDLNAAMPRLADDVNADAQQSQHGAPAPRSDTFTVSNGRDIDAPMDDVTLIGDEKADGTVPSPSGAVLDTLYSLTHCKAGQWSDQKGDDCYRNTVKDLDKDIGQCCAGYEHIVLFEMDRCSD